MNKKNNTDFAKPLSSKEIDFLKEIIAQRLVAARDLRDYSLRYASSQIGISHSQLRNYERGERIPAIDFIFKASRVYKVSVNALLGKEDIAKRTRGKKIKKFIENFFTTFSPEKI